MSTLSPITYDLANKNHLLCTASSSQSWTKGEVIRLFIVICHDSSVPGHPETPKVRFIEILLRSSTLIFEKYLKRLWIAKREQIIEASKKLNFDIELEIVMNLSIFKTQPTRLRLKGSSVLIIIINRNLFCLIWTKKKITPSMFST